MSRTQRIVSKISEGTLRFRRPIGLAITVLVVVILVNLPSLKIDNSISSWYKQDDPAMVEYDNFLQKFGSDDVVVNCIYDSLPYFHSDRIAATIGFANDLKKIKGVALVSSYTNFPYWYMMNGYQALETMDTLPAADAVESWMESNGLKRRLIGSTSPNYVFMYVWPDTSDNTEMGRNTVIAAIDSIYATNYKTSSSHLYKGGLGVVYDGINQTTLTEGKYFLVLSYIMLIVAMLIVSRSYFITFLALMTISCATLFLMGAMLFFGKPMNTLTLALPPLIMVIGVSNFIHFTLHTRQEVGAAVNDHARIFSAITLLAIPIFFNVLTTVGGFLSLTSSSIEITQDYGILAALCEFSVSILSFIAIIIFHKRLFKIDFSYDLLSAITFRVDAIMNWSSCHYKAVIGAILLVVVISIVGISRINIDTKPLSFIPNNHALREGHELITREIGNYISLEFVLKYNKSSWKAKRNLITLDEVQKLVAADTSVTSTLSILDFIKDAYQRTPGNKLEAGEDLSGMSQMKLSQLSSTIQDEPFIRRLSTPDGDELRILAGIPFTSANQFKAIHQRITQSVQSKYGDQLEFRASGYIPLYARIVDTVLTDQINSILLAIGVIFALIFIVLGSYKLALLAMPSNLVPILVILGIMGWGGIPLDIVTVTLAATILAIIVDDTLHMLFAYKRLLAEGLSTEEATNQVAKLTGSAVFSASMILILGYSILAISSVPILSTTGILMVVAVVTGLLADLFLLPAMLRATR